jgi:hypothetical protein
MGTSVTQPGKNSPPYSLKLTRTLTVVHRRTVAGQQRFLLRHSYSSTDSNIRVDVSSQAENAGSIPVIGSNA